VANQDKIIAKANREAQKTATIIRNNLDKLYTGIYSSSPQSSYDSRSVVNSINDKVDKIINNNMDTIGMPTVSKLFARIDSDNGKKEGTSRDISDIFEDSSLMDELYSSFMDNRYLIDMDAEYDTICKYMPKLEEALLIKKDNVLSADYFSKDFLDVANPTDAKQSTFDKRISDLKDTYNLIELVDSSYYKTSKYGEQFIYVVPFKTAIAKLLQYKPNITSSVHESVEDTPFNENFTLFFDHNGLNITDTARVIEYESDGKVLSESTFTDSNGIKSVKKEYEPLLSGNEHFSLNVEICSSGLIENAIIEKYNARKKRLNNKYMSLSETYKVQDKIDSELIIEDADSINGNLTFGSEYGKGQPVQSNGFSRYNNGIGFINIQDTEPPKLNITGSVCKVLKREQVIPIYIENMCMGYYYIELRGSEGTNEFTEFKHVMNDPLSAGLSRDVRTNFDSVNAEKQDETIKYVAGQLAQFIDKKFVDSNQDLSNEIYMILKYNDIFNNPSFDKLKISFVPPEDIIHMNFELNEETHRGISDLAKCIVPAKIYSALYVTNTMMYLSRGADKRVYYVKQNVDQNISQNLLNVIQQIKQGNFNLRSFASINTVLNQTGRFNDYVIPTTASGDYPIQFEVMQGQQVDFDNDFMEKLERMAINSLDVPYELIETRQSVDYATQLSMSNTKFLRIIFKRQAIFIKYLSELITRLYNYEYDEHINLECKLPTPNFLNSTNMSQIVDNAKSYAQSLVEIECDPNENDSVKNEYTKLLMYDVLGSHIDQTKHKELLEKAKLIVQANKDNNSEEDNGY